MKPVYKVLFVILSVPLIITLFASGSGSPGGRTGSPGDNNQTCTACHSGTPVDQSGWISSNIPAAGYTPGTTYQITLNGAQSGVSKFGFEFTSENAAGQKTGTLAITEAARTKLVNQNKAVTHTGGGTSASGGSTSWSFNWTAPAASTGEVRFYATVNATNSNGNTSGDVIHKTNLFVEEAAPAVLVAVSPQQAEQGSSPVLTITGQNTNWSGTAPIVQITGNGSTYTATEVNIINNNELTAAFTIPVDAPIGTYDVKVGELILSNAFSITVLSGLADMFGKSTLVFPNPAADFVNIEAPTGSDIVIYSIDGRAVKSIQTTSENVKVDLTNILKGLYIIDIKSDGKIYTEKLIVK